MAVIQRIYGSGWGGDLGDLPPIKCTPPTDYILAGQVHLPDDPDGAYRHFEMSRDRLICDPPLTDEQAVQVRASLESAYGPFP